MRNYLDDPNLRLPQSVRRRTWQTLLLMIPLALALLVLDQIGVLRPLRNRVQDALTPVTASLSGARNWVTAQLPRPGELQQLRAELAATQQRLSELEAQVIAAEALRVENERLRQQNRIEQARPWQLLGSPVIVRSPDAGRRVITLARGSADGVRPGMAVIGQLGGSPSALIGIVEQVSDHSASVLLITDFGSVISATAYHDGTGFSGTVHGQWQRGSRLRLEQIPADALLVEGDVVLTAGLTAELGLDLPLVAVPPAVPIGTIESLSRDDQTQTADLRPFIDPDQVTYVWVIVSYDD